MAVLADERAVEEVAGIDLHSRLGRQHFEHASARGILEPRGELGFRRQPRVEREIMVVAATDHDLRVGAVADAVGDDAAVAEGSEGHPSELQSLLRTLYAVFGVK